MNALGNLAMLIVFGPIAVLVLGIGGCEATKAYYDWRVSKLCEKDGGVRVYEQMALSPAMFERMKGVTNFVRVPNESEHKVEIPVYRRHKDETVREDHPKISRMETTVIRRTDEKVLGTVVYYARSGGDFPFTGSHPSHFMCPRGAEIEQKIFIVEGAAR